MESVRASVFLEAASAEGSVRGRDSLFLHAQFKVAGWRDERQVRVRNLSSGGLMVELPEPVGPDSPIEIELRGLGWLAGRVAWQTEGRAGIAFDRPIDPQRARKPVSVAKSDAGFRPVRLPG
jgi:hypothetical protein